MKTPKVTVLSTGVMGSAVVHALLNSGHEVTVWNRTMSKTEPLRSAGAKIAMSVEEGRHKSEIIFMIPNPYSTVFETVLNDAILSIVSGKTFLAMASCSTINEPILAEKVLLDAGASLLEGKILSYPTEIGKQQTPLVFSGPLKEFNKVNQVLRVLGGPIYLNENIESAFVYECAMTSWFIATIGAMANGIALCDVKGIPLNAFHKGISASFPGLSEYLQKVICNMIPESEGLPANAGSIMGVNF